MEFRLSFDDKISAILLSKIKQRANGASLNKALKTMIIEWNAIEEAGKWSNSSRNNVISTSDQILSDDDVINQDDDLSGLDAAFKDM